MNNKLVDLEGLKIAAEVIDEKIAAVANQIPEIPEIPTKVSDLEQDIPYLLKHQSLDSYALKTDIPKVPTKISELINDKGYINQEINTADLVPYGYLHKKYYSKEDSDERFLIKEQCIDKYYTKSELDELIVSQVDLEGYATKNALKAVSDALNATDDKLSNYAEKNAVFTKSETIERLNRIDVTDKLDGYALKTDIPDVSEFIKEHQSLANYYTKDQCDIRFLTHHQSLDHLMTKNQAYNVFYTKEVIDSRHYLTQHQKLDSYAKLTDLDSYAKVTDIEHIEFATEKEIINYLLED